MKSRGLRSVTTVLILLAAVAVVVGRPTLVYAASCGEVVVSGSSWANGNGVDVRSNGANQGTGNSCAGANGVYNINANPSQYGLGWQCVELAARLYKTRGWSNGIAVSYAAQIYTNASGLGMTTMAQGAIDVGSIAPGDMVVSDQATYGHVSVVSSVDVTANVIHAVEQNASSSGWADYVFNPTTKRLTRGTYYNVTGVVHDPDNNLASGVGSGLRVTQSLAITPTSPHMYQPVGYSFRIKNTSSDEAWVRRLVVAVRSPGGGALDLICAEWLILGVNQEWSCNLPLQQGYGQQGQYKYWIDWQDWDEGWHTGELGGTGTFTVGQPYALTISQPVSVGPSSSVTMYTPVNYSYRVWNTSGGGVSVQRMVVAVRGPGGVNLDAPCSNGVGLAAGQEFTCAVTVPTGYGSAGQYQFWADWLDFAGNWHAGQLGSTANYLQVTQAATLTTTGALSVGPANPVHMYQGVYWSYRVKNTSGGYVSIKRLEVAVRTPGGGAMDVPCQNGDGVTLAPAQEWTCAAYNNNGYGSTGPFQFWADWQDYANQWHPGQLSGTLTLSVVA